MNGTHLLVTAMDYVEHLRPEVNVFASSPRILSRDPWQACTMCTSFLSLLIEEAFDVPPVLFAATLGSMRPNAARYFEAVQHGLLGAPVERVSELLPGHLGFIRYSPPRNGFSGHSFIVAGVPVDTGERFGTHSVWALPVVDSVRGSHGEGDTRYEPTTGGRGGIGRGVMRIVADSHGRPSGYLWKGQGPGEVFWSGHQQDLVFGRVPAEWKQRKINHG